MTISARMLELIAFCSTRTIYSLKCAGLLSGISYFAASFDSLL